MDKPKRPSEKSYSDVMNEWAAQKNLVNADRSRLLHPPYDASPAAKFFGYLMRVALVTVVPVGIYLALLHRHVSSREFNSMISDGIAQTLGAEKAEARGAQWKFDGMLTMRSLTANGGPEAFYEAFEARNIGTRVPFGGLFRKDWVLHRVSVGELSIALRSGGLGKVPLYQIEEDEINLPSGRAPDAVGPKTGARGQGETRLLRAGYGVEPDFKSMRLNAVHMARLNATWGAGPATSGALTGMQTDLTRTAGGWVISGNGGQLRQGWLEGMTVEKLSVQLGGNEAVIDEVNFTRAGGGKGTFKGRLALGEQPELDGTMHWENVALHDLVPVAAAGLFTAEVRGDLKLSGSVNRTTGIRMEGELELLSGRVLGLPVLKALHQLTGEDQFRLLTLRSGRIRFVSSGDEGHGGLRVEVKEFEVDCGPLARLKGNLKHEQIREVGDIAGKGAVDRAQVTGMIEMGLSATVTTRLKPAVVQRFLKSDASGWTWLQIPVDGPVNSNLSKALAAELLQVSAAAAAE